MFHLINSVHDNNKSGQSYRTQQLAIKLETVYRILFKTIMQRREVIEHFCYNFLYGNECHLHELIDSYRHVLSHINIQQLQLTQDTLDRSFQTICREIFTYRVCSGYIIAVLGFAEAIHNCHYASPWYNIDILTNSLVNVLTDVDFHPDQLRPSSNCIIL